MKFLLLVALLLMLAGCGGGEHSQVYKDAAIVAGNLADYDRSLSADEVRDQCTGDDPNYFGLYYMQGLAVSDFGDWTDKEENAAIDDWIDGCKQGAIDATS